MSRTTKVGSHKTKILNIDNTTYIRYHTTDVVTFNEAMIWLDTGGWNSVTTKLRMNQASRQFDLGYSVYQRKHRWYVEYREVVYPYEGRALILDRRKKVEAKKKLTLPLVPGRKYLDGAGRSVIISSETYTAVNGKACLYSDEPSSSKLFYIVETGECPGMNKDHNLVSDYHHPIQFPLQVGKTYLDNRGEPWVTTGLDPISEEHQIFASGKDPSGNNVNFYFFRHNGVCPGWEGQCDLIAEYLDDIPEITVTDVNAEPDYDYEAIRKIMAEIEAARK